MTKSSRMRKAGVPAAVRPEQPQSVPHAAGANKRKRRGEFEYRGQMFQVPQNAAELRITHAVMGEHALRGPFVVRWMKEHPNPDERRVEILNDVYKLYGSAVSAIRFIDVRG